MNDEKILAEATHVYGPETISFVPDPTDSSNQCLKVTRGGSLPGSRNTEVILSYDQKEYWMSVNYLAPLDFQLSSANKWFSFCNPFFEYIDNKNNLALVSQMWENDLKLVFFVYRVVDGVGMPRIYLTLNPTTYIERGKKFNLVYHIIRDEENGLIEIWKDKQKIVEYHGQTKRIQDRFNFVPVKHYAELDETEKSWYVDDVILATSEADLEVPSGPIIEPPPPGPFTMEVKPCIVTAAGAPLALLAGLRAIRTYLPGWFVKGYYSFSKFLLVGW